MVNQIKYLEYKKNIAFQGIEGANSHLVCLEHFPNAHLKNFLTFEDVFQAVEKKDCSIAIIPFENSYAGRVAEIHQLINSTSLYIVAEFSLEIVHHLAGLKKSNLSEITNVISHPQALLQCRKNLKKYNLKSAPFTNTALAAQKIFLDNDKFQACLCSDLAIKLNNLKILKKNFQDESNNKTIFIALAKKMDELPSKTDKKITSLLFSVKNIPAAIYKSLEGFAQNNINLLKLESYIPSTSSKEASFFISFEGAKDDVACQSALKELEKYTTEIKLLGVYDMSFKRGN